MSSTAQNYFKALLALSGDPASADARKGLLVNIRDQDLVDVIKHGLTEIPRAGLEEVAANLLDILVREQKGRMEMVGPGAAGNASSREQVQGTSGGHGHS